MKIIEKKDWKKEWKFAFTCPQCESKLEAETDDLWHAKSSGGNQRDYCEESFWCSCPICNQRVTVHPESIPSYVQKLARDRTARGNTSYFDR